MFKVVSFLLFFCLLFVPSAQASDLIPKRWKNMEIEAKWVIDKATYNKLVRNFADGKEGYGYKFSVRWGGISRKYLDVYYDTHEGKMGRALHSLRHRSRYRSNPVAKNNTLDELNAASWIEDWQRIQYKSTPCRIGATWFREEKGRCRIRDRRSRRLCVSGKQVDVNEIISNKKTTHKAVVALLNDHPGFNIKSLYPSIYVFDYRYRIEFLRNGEPIFEMSLDRVLSTDLRSGLSKIFYEAELEVLDQETLDDVKNLLAVSREIEKDFGLKPSTLSKGGVSVKQCIAN